MATLSELSKLPISDLRKMAVAHGIQLKREYNAATIAKLVFDMEQGPIKRPTAVTSDERPAPGYARIEIHRDPSPNAGNAPVFFAVNGYQVLIQRGVKVDVPIKILKGSILTAKTEVSRENQNDPNPDTRYTFEEVYMYPFTVYDINEGPDPKPEYENAVRNKMKKRRAFKEKYGYWPKSAELRKFIVDEED